MTFCRSDFRALRWSIFMIALLLSAPGLVEFTFPVATAQEDSPGDEESEKIERPKSKLPTASDLPDEPVERTLLQMLYDSGWCGFWIVVCSIVGVAFIVEHALTIRRGKLIPPQVVEELDGLISEGRIDEAVEACHVPENVSLVSNVVLAGIERYRGSEFGFAEYRAAAEEAGEEQTAGLYRKTEVLAIIGTIAPMLGLLGTVSGMIRSFNVIASTKGAARPYQLASGISEALVTTYMGLVVAIPAMIFFSYFRNKIDSLVAESGKKVEQILTPLGRRKM